VTVQIDGLCASAATFLLSVANKVTAAAGSMVMIHRAWTITMGNKHDHDAAGELLDKIDLAIVETYAQRGAEGTDWMALMDKETWLSVEEAIALGLVTEMITAPDASAQALVAGWDLSAFANAPLVAVPVPVDPPVIEPPVIDTTENEIAARQRRLTVALLHCPA
jgi:ATP-dependent Clp protease protease subunit